jgi:hypothetical protein
MPSPCPICDQQVIVDYTDFGEGLILESREHCLNACYESEFSYGNTWERIGPHVWSWCWTESNHERDLRQSQRLSLILQLRRAIAAYYLNGWTIARWRSQMISAVSVSCPMAEHFPAISWQELGF